MNKSHNIRDISFIYWLISKKNTLRWITILYTYAIKGQTKAHREVNQEGPLWYNLLYIIHNISTSIPHQSTISTIPAHQSQYPLTQHIIFSIEPNNSKYKKCRCNEWILPAPLQHVAGQEGEPRPAPAAPATETKASSDIIHTLTNHTTPDQTEHEIGSSPCGSCATTRFGDYPGCPCQPWRNPGGTKKLESDHLLVRNLVLTVESGALPKQGVRGNLEAVTFEADAGKPLEWWHFGVSRSTSW
jgi:hypothetical protein